MPSWAVAVPQAQVNWLYEGHPRHGDDLAEAWARKAAAATGVSLPEEEGPTVRARISAPTDPLPDSSESWLPGWWIYLRWDWQDEDGSEP